MGLSRWGVVLNVQWRLLQQLPQRMPLSFDRNLFKGMKNMLQPKKTVKNIARLLNIPYFCDNRLTLE